MSPTILNILAHGFNGTPIKIECTMANSLPGIHIIGFANRAVDEAKDRIRSAFVTSNLSLPRKLITINLAPADMPKSDTSFDLGIAISILQTAGIIQLKNQTILFCGELGLDGSIRAVRGVIGKLLEAKKMGIEDAYIPQSNREQASIIDGINIFPVSTLTELYAHIQGIENIAPIQPTASLFGSEKNSNKSHAKTINNFHYLAHKNESNYELQTNPNFAQISGQERAKRALCIAAAGRHNIMLHGPPGTGKSMLAKALVSILPAPNTTEILESSHLHSLATRDFSQLVMDRPFRAPHHSASTTAIIGGGSEPRPGEVSLAHTGVLLLDEFPEFSRHAIEALRQPLEDKIVRVVRTKESVVFPADFMLVATANPCPCGNYESQKLCVCSAQQIINYRKKFSGPVMDRIDLFVRVDAIDPEKMIVKNKPPADKSTTRKIAAAVEAQRMRYGQNRYNNALQVHDIPATAMLQSDAEQLLNTASRHMHLSSRAYIRCIRVARTIADLDNSASIEPAHMAEALQYRANLPMP